MRQRALSAGVLSNPYRFIEAGAEFDHPERMRWAEPVTVEAAEDALEAPEQDTTDDAPRRRGRPPKARPGE